MKTTSSWQPAVERFLGAPGEESFGGLFHAVAPAVMNFFHLRGYEHALAEDLTQEVMVAVYLGVGGLRENELFRAWLFGIARNVGLRHLRDNRRRPATVPYSTDAEETCAAEADPLRGPQMAEWMEVLEPEEREIMLLRYMEELEYHEIASLLRISIGTVQWKVFRARKKLAARFGNGETK
jgi:RNA polymerase sigma-70 factor (ECF subfamily)